jgi:hypothetical protein
MKQFIIALILGFAVGCGVGDGGSLGPDTDQLQSEVSGKGKDGTPNADAGVASTDAGLKIDAGAKADAGCISNSGPGSCNSGSGKGGSDDDEDGGDDGDDDGGDDDDDGGHHGGDH